MEICNDLLSIATTLQTWKLQANNSCCRCEQQETTYHIIQCQAQSQTEWRIKTITKMQKQIKQLDTKFELEET